MGETSIAHCHKARVTKEVLEWHKHVRPQNESPHPTHFHTYRNFQNLAGPVRCSPGPEHVSDLIPELSERGNMALQVVDGASTFSGYPWDISALPRSRAGRGAQPLGAGQVRLPRSGKKASLLRATDIQSQVRACGHSESTCGLPIALVTLLTLGHWGMCRWADDSRGETGGRKGEI